MKTHFLSELRDQLVAGIDSKVAELEAAIMTAIRGAGIPEAPTRKAPKIVAAVGGPVRTKGQKRSPKELEMLESRLLRYVKIHPGQGIEQIAKGMTISTKELNLPMRKLVADGAIKTKGEKRATKYTA